MTVKQLGQRQLFTMKRKSLEARVIRYYNETKDSDSVVEYAVAILVRNALSIGGAFSDIFKDLIRSIFMEAEPSAALRQFMPYFQSYFSNDEWRALINRLFKNKSEYHHFKDNAKANIRYLTPKNSTKTNEKSSFNLISVFRAADGKKHTWTLKDIDNSRNTEEIRALLKILSSLTILKKDDVRRFAQLVTFDIFESTHHTHFEEPQPETQAESAQNTPVKEKNTKKTTVRSVASTAKAVNNATSANAGKTNSPKLTTQIVAKTSPVPPASGAQKLVNDPPAAQNLTTGRAAPHENSASEKNQPPITKTDTPLSGKASEPQKTSPKTSEGLFNKVRQLLRQ